MDRYRRGALLKEYDNVVSNFRLLTGIRFRLLAFLPIVSGAATGVVLKGGGVGVMSLALSLFGLVVTVGVVTYNARNDQLYDALVARAAAIERSLGVPDGAFANRPRAWFVIELLGPKSKLQWKVDHGTGVAWIYRASITLWLFGVLASLFELLCRLLPQPGILHLVGWSQVCALVLAVLIIYQVSAHIGEQHEIRATRIRDLAVQTVTAAMCVDVGRVDGDDVLLGLCSALAGRKRTVISARAAFLARVPSESIGGYLLAGSAEHRAAQLVAYLTDLAPEWLYDCVTDRRGAVAGSREKRTSNIGSRRS